MLYPAELQALPQPRGVRLAQDFNLCLASQDVGKDCQSVLFIWSIWSIWFNQTNETDQINQTDQTDRACLTLAVYEPVRQEYFFSCRSGVSAKRVQ